MVFMDVIYGNLHKDHQVLVNFHLFISLSLCTKDNYLSLFPIFLFPSTSKIIFNVFRFFY